MMLGVRVRARGLRVRVNVRVRAGGLRAAAGSSFSNEQLQLWASQTDPAPTADPFLLRVCRTS